MYMESPPGELTGKALYDYLFRLSEALNVAMAQTEEKEREQKEAYASVSPAAKKANEELKSLIINTSNMVHREMDELSTHLHGQYTAISEEFGTFQENLTSTITATAEGVVQQFGYESRLDALDAAAAGFDVYRNKTEGYIRQGFIDYDEHGVPILGVAIGQNLKSTTVTVDGQTVEQFDSAQSCAFYTSEKVSFRIGGNEVAYISNRKLYILDAEVTGSLTVGGWLMSHGIAGLTLRYIGG